MSMLRAAVVGVGMIGSLHARIYAEHPLTELVAVADSNPERARTAGEQLGVAWYSDVEQLLARERVAIASIATPEQQRYTPAVACARAGVHLLLEKPLAPNLAETDRLIAAVEATGVRATVNFILRSDARYLHARQSVEQGMVGEVCTLSARRRGSARGAELYGPWTDLLISTAIHDLDAMVWINGTPVERVFAEAVVKRCAEWGHEDAVLVVLRFANGAIGSLETSWVLPPTVPAALDSVLQIAGTRGGIFIEGNNQGVAVVGEDRYHLPDFANWPIGPLGVGGALQANVARFITGVSRGEPLPMTLQEARYAQAMVVAVKNSIRTGQPSTVN